MKRIFPLLTLLALAAAPVLAQSFGSTVAVHDNHVIAGGSTNAISPGALYVYTPGPDGAWTETTTISAQEHGRAGDNFGRSVSVFGDMMAVGAPGSNHVHIFTADESGSWVQSGMVMNDSEGFGSTVVLEGDMLLVTAQAGRRANGQVFAYKRAPDGAWNGVGELVAEDVPEGSQYGASLTASGGHAVVAAPLANEFAGAAWAFRWDDALGKWIANGNVAAPITGQGSQFGATMLMADAHLAVGMPGHDNRMGAVAVFRLDDESGQWSFSERLSSFSASRGQGFGSALAVSGSTLYVGAPGQENGYGAVFTFVMDTETVSIVSSGLMVPRDLQTRNSLGSTLAANDQIMVAGATAYDNRAGAAIPFVNQDGEWIQGAPVWKDPQGYASVTGGPVECEDGEAVSFPCEGVDMLSFLDMSDLGADRGVRTNDIWGWEDPETNREYALVGITNQTSFVDVTDPSNPVLVGTLPLTSTARPSVWRDIKVFKDHAFIVADGAGEHGMQVFDLRQLRNVENPPVEFEETAHYGEIYSAHNIVINEDTGYAYSVGSSSGGTTCGGGLHMIDINEPANPTFAGCYSDGETGRRGTGYSHDAQCVIYHGPDPDYDGHEICLGSNETALSIADVTDKENPVTVSTATYPNVAYTHQGWLTDDHRYFYMNDEGDEPQGLVEGTRTLIFDLEDLDEPVLVGEHIAETTETDHNLYIKDNLMYQSNYGAGFRVLDISDPANPVEVAYFDTSPVGGGGGSWSNYPYFDSGTIVVTGGSNGLFILKKKE
ncbi:MAG: choice-of-anchor B family protein, partial [Rhodothermales bacterium]|nr:choice-of-anchor B family protein [Rhodothermales bacterium]